MPVLSTLEMEVTTGEGLARSIVVLCALDDGPARNDEHTAVRLRGKRSMVFTLNKLNNTSWNSTSSSRAPNAKGFFEAPIRFLFIFFSRFRL